MKYFVIVMMFCLSVFASENKTKVDITKPHKISEHEKLSDKEKKYQAYKAQLEKENQKLEDDGFCSCNNN